MLCKYITAIKQALSGSSTAPQQLTCLVKSNLLVANQLWKYLLCYDLHL